MPTWLTKQYGPFTGTVWVVVIVGGVGLGLVMRRYFNRPGDVHDAETTAVTAPGSSSLSPAFVGGGTLYNQGEIVADVLEAIQTQTPPPPTTEPEVPTTPPPPPGEPARVGQLRATRANLIAQRNAKQTQRENLIANFKSHRAAGRPAMAEDARLEAEGLEDEIRALNARINGIDAEINQLLKAVK